MILLLWASNTVVYSVCLQFTDASDAQEQWRPQKVVDIGQSITGTDLATTEGIYRECCFKKLLSSDTYATWLHPLLAAVIGKKVRESENRYLQVQE